MTSTIVPMSRITHAHVTSDSRDCDGFYENDYVWFPPEGMTFAEVWMGSLVADSAVDWHHSQTLERGVTADGYPTYEFYAITDEGFRREHYVGCDDYSCDPNRRRYRDHTAESMGY
jgi:hypothetical protein